MIDGMDRAQLPLPSKQKLFDQLTLLLEKTSPSSWEEIYTLLTEVRNGAPTLPQMESDEFLRIASVGSAFVTFDYGIDGVSIEISKYAQALQKLLKSYGKANLHFIGGDFYHQADSVLKPGWKRFRIEGINGWSKWDDGKWFAGLFYEDMPAGSERSSELASEVYRQAVAIAQQLGRYIVDHQISILIPVNIASNPGNIALTLAFVLVSEALGLNVLNSNHDFYWDGGKPSSERGQDEAPGVRDHFFRNNANESFFRLFRSLFPWDGIRWLQTNINTLQTHQLTSGFGFSERHVLEINTCVSDEFFKDYSQEEVKVSRLRMGHILSDGDPILHSYPVAVHIEDLTNWMRDQTPRILGMRAGLPVDPTSDDLIYLLQPTRIVARKRIERNLHLIRALMVQGRLMEEFDKNPNLQLVLHITGPTPIEHQHDHERVMHAYLELIEQVPEHISERIFVALSVGHEEHASFQKENFLRLTIEDIYRMATAVVFPSETEGRGLPIIESSACGVPIICSRYNPVEVFADVVGEHLPPEQQIEYIQFPEGEFSDSFLEEVTDLFLNSEMNRARIERNKTAVRSRYSIDVLEATFEDLLERLRTIE
jgi:glycosyltransferase involved in cell wall biosynthesis